MLLISAPPLALYICQLGLVREVGPRPRMAFFVVGIEACIGPVLPPRILHLGTGRGIFRDPIKRVSATNVYFIRRTPSGPTSTTAATLCTHDISVAPRAPAYIALSRLTLNSATSLRYPIPFLQRESATNVYPMRMTPSGQMYTIPGVSRMHDISVAPRALRVVALSRFI